MGVDDGMEGIIIKKWKGKNVATKQKQKQKHTKLAASYDYISK